MDFTFVIFVYHFLNAFDKHTKLAILALFPTLYSHIIAVSFFICNIDVSKCEIRYQLMYLVYTSVMQTSLVKFLSNGLAKTKLAILAFLYCLYCGEFV